MCGFEIVLWGIWGISIISIIPAVFGSEFGFRRLYIKLLVDLFDWATGYYYILYYIVYILYII